MTLPLSSQCCSFESARRLQELGVKASCLFGWVYEEDIKTWTIVYGAYSLPAYTTGELGEMLRPFLSKNVWLPEIGDVMSAVLGMENEPESRSKMLIYLIERGIWFPKQ